MMKNETPFFKESPNCYENKSLEKLYHIKVCLETFLYSHLGESIKQIAEPFVCNGTRAGFLASLSEHKVFLKVATPKCFFQKFNGYGSDVEAFQSLKEKQIDYYIVFAYHESDDPYLLPPKNVFITDISTFLSRGIIYYKGNQCVLPLQYFLQYEVWDLLDQIGLFPCHENIA